MNVVPVWRKGITGRGVVVSILDDGIDHSHPDLQRNYVRCLQIHISQLCTFLSSVTYVRSDSGNVLF